VALATIKPDIFANGGDRKSDNIPEYGFCLSNNIKMVFNVGGEKLRSSSELVSNYNKNKK
jgi:D-beta-D-heptose 7-phosphate kinase/D-beta-D-heptose 1-phosphate adenosyltransferase